MPSVADSPSHHSYLPPLDQTLARDLPLISWTLAHEALTSPELSSSTIPLQSFLSDDLSIKALAQCLRPTRPANGQTKADFETRTASINAPPSETADYDIKQIKDDSLWLSKLVEIDEVLALRIVVLEWQNRTAADILEGYSEEEMLSLEQSIGGLRNFGGSQFGASFGKSIMTNGTTQETEKKRQARLLQTWFREHERLLAVAVHLQTIHTLQLTSQSDWLKGVATKVSASRGGAMNAEETPAQRLGALMEALDRHMKLLSNQVGTSLPPDSESVEYACQQRSRLLEATHILRMIFLEIKSTSHLRSTQAIAHWFRIMMTYDFMQMFRVAELDQQTIVEMIQSFAALISMQILDYSRAKKLTGDDSSGDANSWYALDNECCRQICATISQAANYGLNVAAPAILCWSVIGDEVRRQASETSTRRLSLDGEDGTRSPVLSRSDGTPLGDARQNFQDIEFPPETSDKEALTRDPMVYLAQTAVNKLDVLSIVAGLATTAQSIWGPGFADELEFQVRRTLLDVLQLGSGVCDYTAELLDTAMAVLRPGSAGSKPTATDRRVVNAFLADDPLLDNFLSRALIRYPLELAPLLELCSVLAAGDRVDEDGMPILTYRLMNAQQFTLQMPQDFNDYELVRNRGLENSVRLTKDLDLFATVHPTSSFIQRLESSRELVLSNPQSSLSIPAGTFGIARTDARPFVATWYYDHSTLSFAAALLATAIPSIRRYSITEKAPLSRDSQAGVIRLFTSQINLILRSAEASKKSKAEARALAQELLGSASEGLPQDCDIISLLGDIVETELAAQPLQSDDDAIDILDSCIAFLQAALPVLPDRIWPLLTRIGLVDGSGPDGKLRAVIASIEIATGRYSFLLACLRLYDALVKDIIENALMRAGSGTASTSRFKDTPSYQTGIPSKMIAQILESFTRLFLEVLRSSRDWRFADINEQLNLNLEAIQIFHSIVRVVYGFDDSVEISNKLPAALAPAAKLLMESHCGDAGDLSNNAVVRLCTPTSETTLDTVTTTAVLIRRQSSAALRFLTLLLQVGGLNNAPLDSLKRQLFQAVPALVRIYVSEPSQRVPVVELLTALVLAAGNAEGEEVPSLFGHLGAATAQKAIILFSRLGKPLDDERLEIAIWDMFAAVVSSKQQWFATYLLTGSVPNKSYRRTANSTTKKHKAVLDQAMDILADSDDLPHKWTASILQFVNDAVNHWPWSIARVKAHSAFIPRMTLRIALLDYRHSNSSNKTAVDVAWQIKILSLLTEMFAMYIHHLRRMGDVSFAKELAQSVWIFKRGCVGDPSYAGNLHARLQQNLEQKLPAIRMQSFKNLLPTHGFGSDFFYDTGFAGQAIASHIPWQGDKRDNGFESELKRANYNLSLVEAQIQNVKSLKLIAIEFSNYAKDDTTLQENLAYLVHDCLSANRNAPLEALVFENLAEIRAEIALPILQRLIDYRASMDVMHTLLAPAWNAVIASEQDFDHVLLADDAEYYRLLLRLLLLALQPLTYSTLSGERPEAAVDRQYLAERVAAEGEEAEKVKAEKQRQQVEDEKFTIKRQEAEAEKVATIIAICRDVVARGFKSLCGQAHDQPFSVLPSDFSLLTTIFQSVMRVRTKELSGFEGRVATALAEQGLTRYATSLFSWADRLIAANDDPIYGEISMTFIHEMSCIPALAEKLAADGVLAQISAANITTLYRRSGGIGPFDDPIRMYSIWSRGILPTCLNLLVAAGESFSSEVATFLNNFGPQMERASAGLEPTGLYVLPRAATSGCITLSSACEAHTLALISTALEQSGEDGSALAWDRAAVKEDAESWVHGSRGALRERILATTEKELALQQVKATGQDKDLAACQNRLEEMVLQELRGALFVLNRGH